MAERRSDDFDEFEFDELLERYLEGSLDSDQTSRLLKRFDQEKLNRLADQQARIDASLGRLFPLSEATDAQVTQVERLLDDQLDAVRFAKSSPRITLPVAWLVLAASIGHLRRPARIHNAMVRPKRAHHNNVLAIETDVPIAFAGIDTIVDDDRIAIARGIDRRLNRCVVLRHHDNVGGDITEKTNG